MQLPLTFRNDGDGERNRCPCLTCPCRTSQELRCGFLASLAEEKQGDSLALFPNRKALRLNRFCVRYEWEPMPPGYEGFVFPSNRFRRRECRFAHVVKAQCAPAKCLFRNRVEFGCAAPADLSHCLWNPMKRTENSLFPAGLCAHLPRRVRDAKRDPCRNLRSEGYCVRVFAFAGECFPLDCPILFLSLCRRSGEKTFRFALSNAPSRRRCLFLYPRLCVCRSGLPVRFVPHRNCLPPCPCYRCGCVVKLRECRAFLFPRKYREQSRSLFPPVFPFDLCLFVGSKFRSPSSSQNDFPVLFPFLNRG